MFGFLLKRGGLAFCFGTLGKLFFIPSKEREHNLTSDELIEELKKFPGKPVRIYDGHDSVEIMAVDLIFPEEGEEEFEPHVVIFGIN